MDNPAADEARPVPEPAFLFYENDRETPHPVTASAALGPTAGLLLSWPGQAVLVPVDTLTSVGLLLAEQLSGISHDTLLANAAALTGTGDTGTGDTDDVEGATKPAVRQYRLWARVHPQSADPAPVLERRIKAGWVTAPRTGDGLLVMDDDDAMLQPLRITDVLFPLTSPNVTLVLAVTVEQFALLRTRGWTQVP